MSAENALADLGLDLGEATPTETVEQAAPVTEDAADVASTVARTAVKVEVAGFDDNFEDLPPLVRAGFGGGPREKKYPFDELPAPKDLGEGRMGYASFSVVPAEGEDIDRAVRSVQSATTQANRSAKEAGGPEYFVTRTFNDEQGATKGVKVFRTDARPEKGE